MLRIRPDVQRRQSARASSAMVIAQAITYLPNSIKPRDRKPLLPCPTLLPTPVLSPLAWSWSWPFDSILTLIYLPHAPTRTSSNCTPRHAGHPSSLLSSPGPHTTSSFVFFFPPNLRPFFLLLHFFLESWASNVYLLLVSRSLSSSLDLPIFTQSAPRHVVGPPARNSLLR